MRHSTAISKKGANGSPDRASIADRSIVASGIALALASSAFAYVELRGNDGAPTIYGVDHLALFAQPSRVHAERSPGGDERTPAVRPSIAARSARFPSDSVDFATTASIRPPSATSRIDPGMVGASQNEKRYRLVSVSNDRAVFEGANGRKSLRRGEYAEGIGRVVDIIRRNAEWVAIIAPAGPEDQTSR